MNAMPQPQQPQSQNWWDAVVDPAMGEPQGYFLGGLIGDIWGGVKDFASNNPFTTGGAVIGGLTGGSKGLVKGALLGAGGDAAFSPSSYSSQWLGTNGNSGGLFSGFGATPQAPAGGSIGTGGAPTTGIANNPYAIGPTTAGGGAPGLTAGATSSAGITGSFGGAGVPAAGGVLGRANAGLAALSDFGKSNPALTQGGIQLAAGLYGMRAQKKIAGAQQDALRRQGEVFDYNRSVADAGNRDAQQVVDDARSTTNPYNMATQGYAQAQRAGQRAVDGIEQAGLSAGRSPGTTAAEARRAKLQTSLGATTAYNSGFSTGANAQRAGVSAGNSMRRTISGGDYNSSLGTAMQGNADAEQGQITALLENYMGNPSEVKKRQETAANGAVRQ